MQVEGILMVQVWVSDFGFRVSSFGASASGSGCRAQGDTLVVLGFGH